MLTGIGSPSGPLCSCNSFGLLITNSRIVVAASLRTLASTFLSRASCPKMRSISGQSFVACSLSFAVALFGVPFCRPPVLKPCAMNSISLHFRH